MRHKVVAEKCAVCGKRLVVSRFAGENDLRKELDGLKCFDCRGLHSLAWRVWMGWPKESP